MIQLQKLQLRRGQKLLLDNADLMVHAGWKMGLIGANGCGKSSLFALLRGKITADQGEASLPKDWIIAHVAQETPTSEESALDYTLSGDEELHRFQQALKTAQGLAEAQLHSQIEAIDGYRAPARAGQILHGLGFSPQACQQAVKTFSGGWRMRLNLARTLMCRADLLLLDEPTNHLDLDAVLWFEQWLKQYTGTLLLISHDRDFLNQVVGHIAHLDQQKLTVYTGDYDLYEQQRAMKLAQQQAAYQKQQTQIAHLQQFIQRFKAKASKAKQAQSRVKALAKLDLISAAHLDSPFQFEFPPPEHNPNPLLNLDKVSVAYGEKTVLQDVQLQLLPAMRLALLGANGAGKSTLIKLLAGQITPTAGQIKPANNLKIGYFSQHQLETLDPHGSPLLHTQRLKPYETEQSLKNFLGGFGFSGDMALTATAPFSGGEKARLALALLVLQAPNLLLLDEPTNHLDLEMRHALTVALQSYSGALVLVSHDRHLLRATTDQFLWVANQKITPFDGDLEDYRQWLLNQNKTTTEVKTEKPQKQQHFQRKQLNNQLKKLEKQLDSLNQQQAGITLRLTEPDVYHDHQQVRAYAQQNQDLEQQISQLEEEWLLLSERLESASL